MVKLRRVSFIFVAFLLTLSLLVVPGLVPRTVSAQGEADLPNPLTVTFSASVSLGTDWSFSVVPNSTWDSVLNQYARPWVILTLPGDNNTPARFYNMSTASGTTSGDLNGNIDLKFSMLDFEKQHPNSSTWYLGTPDGMGIMYMNFTVTNTILENLTFVGAADFDYAGTTIKGEGRVMSKEDFETGLTTPPSRVLIGDMYYQISGGTISGSFSLRHYARTPVGLEGKVGDQEWLYLSGNLTSENIPKNGIYESDWITNETNTIVQFTRPPCEVGKTAKARIEMEEMAPGREENQTILAGDLGVGGTISLLRTGVMDYFLVGEDDFPLRSVTGTRTIENNWGSNKSATKGGIAKTIVLVDMVGADLYEGEVYQHSVTMMPGYSNGYKGTGFYAGFESYVVPNTTIYIATFNLAGDDFRYPLLPKPQVTSVSPNVGTTGVQQVTINGKFFLVNETYHPLNITWGAGITEINHTVVDDNTIVSWINIATANGPRNVTVEKRGMNGTLVDGFGVGSAMDGQAGFAGRTSGTDAYVELFKVCVFDNATQTEVAWSPINRTTNETGYLVITTGRDPGDNYDVAVDSASSVSNLVRDVTLPAAGNSIVVAFGTIREGDANGDEWVTSSDKAKLYGSWGTSEGAPGWNPKADFNNDGWLTSADKALLYGSWGYSGGLVGYPGSC